jgi:arsenate reductase
MDGKKYNILFICTGNSARSIIAESLARQLGHDRLQAFSAGSQPKGEVHPMALQVLRGIGLPTEGLRSKSWEEFAAPEAPVMDLIITVCDRAANEHCPAWPGHPLTARWSVVDPAEATGTPKDIDDAFRRALFVLQQRISLFLALRVEAIDRLVAQSQISAIGNDTGTTQ